MTVDITVIQHGDTTFYSFVSFFTIMISEPGWICVCGELVAQRSALADT